jgi:hypothetical protein
MSANNVLRWRDGRGWLILAGGASDEIRASALARVDSDGNSAYVSLGNESGSSLSLAERTLEDMEDLGARSGYIVDVTADDDETLLDRLKNTSIVAIPSSGSVETMRAGLMGAAIKGIQAAHENGAVILAEGAGAVVFGTWVLLDSNIVEGLKWVENVIVVLDATSISQQPAIQRILKAQPEAIAIRIGGDSALALGPDGEIELWGKKQITRTLGSGYQA